MNEYTTLLLRISHIRPGWLETAALTALLLGIIAGIISSISHRCRHRTQPQN